MKIFAVKIVTYYLKIFGFTIGLLQTCGTVSGEVYWQVIQQGYLTILLYGVISVNLLSA